MNAGEGGSDAWPGAITTSLNLPDRCRPDDSLGHHLPTPYPAVGSMGPTACLKCGSFQHLRGSMFCGARAKCDLAPFGCDSFHQLPAHSLPYGRSKLPSSPQNHSSFSNATFSSRVLIPVTVAIRANSVFHDSGGADSRGGTTCLALRRKVSTIAA
jgi:hypothetical protein